MNTGANCSHAFAGTVVGAAGAAPALAPALGGVPGLLPAPVTANFCFFSAGFSICTKHLTAQSHALVSHNASQGMSHSQEQETVTRPLDTKLHTSG